MIFWLQITAIAVGMVVLQLAVICFAAWAALGNDAWWLEIRLLLSEARSFVRWLLRRPDER